MKLIFKKKRVARAGQKKTEFLFIATRIIFWLIKLKFILTVTKLVSQ